MKKATRAPSLTHAKATELCEAALRALGLDVERGLDYRDGYDFLINGNLRIAVRYAFPTTERQQTYKKRNGEISRYLYKRWTFNFHRHGRISERYCDFFVCFLGTPSSNGSGNTAFTIPWEAITGLTFCSSCREGSTRPYRGKYAVYQDRWDLIVEAAQAGREAIEREAPSTLKIADDERRRLQAMTGNEPLRKGQRRRDVDARNQPASRPAMRTPVAGTSS